MSFCMIGIMAEHVGRQRGQGLICFSYGTGLLRSSLAQKPEGIAVM